ncbi:MAG: efflux RND transporter periplasmic adaptor subunit [Verrucomicrobia bacterium]|nr:efflux RND transporter periplasmic adaptor subunit [Verrucomicrobiota bacterium]
MGRLFHRVLWPSLIVAGCLCQCLILHGAESKPATTVEVRFVHPKRSDITRNITLPANVKAYQQTTLYAKVAGYLKAINVDKGDPVKEGDMLADIEVPELIADLAKFKTEVDVAKLDFERTVEAQKKAPDLVVPQTVDNARGKYEVAKAGLERIEKLLGFAKIAAPFSGVITMRYVDPGAFIPAATSGSAANTAAILTLMDFSRVRVQVAVPEPEVPRTAKGQPVTVSVEELPGRNYRGEVTRISYALDEASKTMLVEAELANPKWELRPGMFAQAKIGVERKSGALLIPVEGLVVERGGNSVFTVVDGKAKKVAVKTGFDDGTNVEIISGASAEDRVILVGKQTLAAGQAVNAVEAR